MKKIFYGVLLVFLLATPCFADGFLGLVNTFSHKIDYSYWDTDSGKCIIKSGEWRFGNAHKIISPYNGVTLREEYTCFVKISLQNNSNEQLSVSFAFDLLDNNGFTLYSAQGYSPGSYSALNILQPGEEKELGLSFSVLKSAALETSKLEIRAGFK